MALRRRVERTLRRTRCAWQHAGARGGRHAWLAPGFSTPELLLPAHRAIARRDAKERRLRQTRVAAGIRLDLRYASSELQVVRRQRRQEGCQHRQGAAVRTPELATVDRRDDALDTPGSILDDRSRGVLVGD